MVTVNVHVQDHTTHAVVTSVCTHTHLYLVQQHYQVDWYLGHSFFQHYSKTSICYMSLCSFNTTVHV